MTEWSYNIAQIHWKSRQRLKDQNDPQNPYIFLGYRPLNQTLFHPLSTIEDDFDELWLIPAWWPVLDSNWNPCWCPDHHGDRCRDSHVKRSEGERVVPWDCWSLRKKHISLAPNQPLHVHTHRHTSPLNMNIHAQTGARTQTHWQCQCMLMQVNFLY